MEELEGGSEDERIELREEQAQQVKTEEEEENRFQLHWPYLVESLRAYFRRN